MKTVTEAPQQGRRSMPVDPRIRRRQIDVRRAAGRRRLRVVAAVLVVAALVAGAWGATRTALLDVDRIVVEGVTHTPPDEVRAVSGIDDHQPMTEVDAASVSRRLSRLAWVLRSRVSREWPGTVRIRVVERTATAVTSDDAGGLVLVDRSGRVLERAAARPPGLPLVEGIPTPGGPGTRVAPEAADALEVAASLPAGLGARVGTVALGATGGVELRLVPKGVVLLGSADGIGDKLAAAHAVLGTVDGRTVATLDVRAPNTPVLTRD